MNKNKISTLTTIAFAASLSLAACGGGGGGGGSTAASGSNTSTSGSGNTGTTSATTGNVTTPQYANNSAQQALFNTINAQRTQCGFPALTENTLLDKSSQAHADYMGQNGGTITDTEVSGNPGFTGVDYAARATAVGYPASTVFMVGESGGYYTNATLTEAAYGAGIANSLAGSVYHVDLFILPVTQIGIGWNETTFDNYPEAHAAITAANLQPMTGSLPLMFPCDGATGVRYKVTGETPTPPNTNGTYGPAISVAANSSDVVVLTSGTLTDTSGNVIVLQLLNSTNDPNNLTEKYEARAYSATPLTANTKYSVSLAGTIDGTPFSRTGSFTTGS
ncbi:CAP domain-containing protein [Paraburkholderia acidisoli]|uniref:CAP domain-containing protein n=1 Tax=Paraburkholderia acidisoli TaxID=2571748 RepID=A0A7Z2GS65_9BURK|nr:CAP domain-containing protein [Paraburkholderia acidisoli]QGZ66976.1 CAP domain-containing protein [Paraburkholderia acidisoli]